VGTGLTAPYNTITLNGFQYKINPGSYRDDPIPYFAQQRRTGQPDFNGYVPEVPTFFNSFHLGYGQLYYEGETQNYYTSNGLDASIQRQITLALAAASTGMANHNQMEPINYWAEFKQTLFAVGSTGVYSWAPTGSPNGWSLSLAGSINGVTFGQPAVYAVSSLSATASLPAGQYLIVPAASWQYFLGGTGSAWVPVGTMAAHLQTIRNEMWKAYYDQYGNWQIVKTTDGLTYPNPNNISTLADNGAATINSLLNYDNRLFVIGLNGITTIDSAGTVYSVGPEIGKYEDNRFLRGADVFHDIAYIPSDFGMLSYTGSVVLNPQTEQTVTSVGPDQHSWTQSDVRGHFRGVAPDVNFLYATMDADSGSGYVMKFRDYPDASPGQGWHPIEKFTTGKMGQPRVSQLPWYGQPYPVLWFSAGPVVYQMRLPTENDNPLTNSNLQYQTSGTLDLPIIDDGMPSLLKDYVRYVVEFSAPTNSSVSMFAQINQSGTFNSVGGTVTATTAVFEFDFSDVGTTGYNIQPRLRLTASTSQPTASWTPYVRSIVLHHLIRPIQRDQWTFDVVADNNAFPGDNMTAHDKIKNLRAARNTITPILFFDLFNEGHQVTFENLGIRQTGRKEGDGPIFLASVELKSYAINRYYTMSAYTQVSFTSDPATQGIS
jgi:hypothetical protein